MQNTPQNLQHLYRRAGFGLSATDFRRLQNQNLAQCLNDLLNSSQALEPIVVQTGSTPDVVALRQMDKNQRREMFKKSREKIKDLNLAWLKQLRDGKSILQEKMALFWHNHFACQSRNIYHAQKQLNTLRRLALGKFEDLLLAIAKDPAMLHFLNNQQNVKRKPNENFARELLELFTIGRGNYQEQDIKEAARAFTGWAANGDEFIFRERQHDFGEKTFMGETGNFSGEDIIRIILKQKPTAYFLCDKIYRYFVNPQPQAERIKALAEYFYSNNYDITALMRKIFTAEWFYASENIGVKIKSPVELLLGLNLELGMEFKQSETLLFLQKFLGQVLLNPPNVAGWAGDRNWIDSSTLLLRLRLTQAAYFSQSLELENKANFDAQAQGISRRDLRRFEASFNWKSLEQSLDLKAEDEQTSWHKLRRFLLADLDQGVSDKLLKTYQTTPQKNLALMAILLTSLPEYQLC